MGLLGLLLLLLLELELSVGLLGGVREFAMGSLPGGGHRSSLFYYLFSDCCFIIETTYTVVSGAWGSLDGGLVCEKSRFFLGGRVDRYRRRY